jgi:2TM domain
MKEDELPERGDRSIRDRALERIEKKQEFHAHLLAYVLVNAMLVGIWAVTGAGFFWPVFPLLGWGIGIGFQAWDTYRPGEPSEQQIQREIEHLRKVG